MFRPFRFVRLVMLVAAFGGPRLAAQPAAAPAPSPVRAAVEKAAAALPAGGFVLGEITRRGATYASAGKPSPRPDLAPETVLFEIGSITKVFTGLLLAQTVLEGKATLADPIGKHLPPDVAAALAPEAAAITLEHLATHTSGLPALPGNFKPTDQLDPYADYTVAQLHGWLREYRPTATPPQPAAYSNVGFGLLGHLLERIHGRTYAELVAARITLPLGMRDTVIELDADRAGRFATPHSGTVATKPWRLPTLAGAGALRSTAADLARFAQALLTGSNKDLSAAWELARQPRVDFASRGSKVGLAVMIARRGDDPVYFHGGGTGGFRSYLELVPTRGTAQVLLLNNDDPDPGAIVAGVLRPKPAAGASATSASSPPAAGAAATPAAREETPLPPGKAKDYAGVYALDERARFTVVVDAGGRLRARLTGQGFLPIFHAGNDRFFARVVAAEFQFSRDAAGAVVALTLHQNGREMPAKRDAAASAAAPALLFPTAAELKAYAGRYQLTPALVFEVSVRGDALLVKLTGQPALPVFALRADHFVYDGVPAALTFERDAAGGVTSVTLHQNGRDQRAPRLAAADDAKK